MGRNPGPKDPRFWNPPAIAQPSESRKSIGLDPAIHIRPLRDSDTDGVVTLYDRATVTEAGIGPVPHAAWRRFVKLPHNQDGRDFRVAQYGEDLVGLAESSLKEQSGRQVRFFKLVVEPTMRLRGIGSALLEELLALDISSEKLSLQSLASRDWSAGLAFLNSLGFSHIESEISQRCLFLKAPRSICLAGLSLERVANPPAYAHDIARIHNAAFASDVAFRPYTAAEMAPLLSENVLWVARNDSRIVGFCRLESEPDLTWLEVLAIDPEHQGQGLGAALAYCALRATGVGQDRPAGLNVSSANLAALSVYKRLGFEPSGEMCRFGAYHHDLKVLMEQRRRRREGAQHVSSD